MDSRRVISGVVAAILIVAIAVIPACRITATPDGGIEVEFTEGKPRRLPPSRVYQITIDGKCYFQFEGRDGTRYCFSCELEGDGYAEPCNDLIGPRNNQGEVVGTSLAFAASPTPVGFSSPEERAFMSTLSVWMQQEGIPIAHDSIWFHFGLDQWVEGETAEVPTALVELSDDEDGFLKLMMITRTDWDFPDNSNGSGLEYYFLRDASDDVPDAMVLQLSGTFQQVADSMKTFYDGVFTLDFEYDGYAILVIGDQNLVSFIIDGMTVWEG